MLLLLMLVQFGGDWCRLVLFVMMFAEYSLLIQIVQYAYTFDNSALLLWPSVGYTDNICSPLSWK